MRETVDFINNKGERVVVDICSCEHDKKDKKGLMALWLKHGYLKKFLPTTLHVQTYVYDKDGYCRGLYNPTVKISNDQKRLVTNFDYMLEDTPENRAFLINEVKRLADA